MLKKKYSCSSKIPLPSQQFSNAPLLNITDEKDPGHGEYIAPPGFLFNMFIFVSLFFSVYFAFAQSRSSFVIVSQCLLIHAGHVQIVSAQ